jgi:hypothetical protein
MSAPSIRVVVLVAAVFSSMASASGKDSYRPELVASPPGVTDEDLYVAAIRVFADLGYGLQLTDEKAGLVVSGWMLVDTSDWEPDESPHSRQRWEVHHAWRAIVAEGTFRMAIDCQRVDGHGAFPCRGDERFTSFVETEAAMRRVIFEEAIRRAHARQKPPEAPSADAGADAGPDAAPQN